MEGWLEGAAEILRKIGSTIWEEYYAELRYAAILITIGLIRAAGKTVTSGNTGLKFSFGRATREIEPGFHLLIPFLQVIRTMPTRHRTLDLPVQRVTTLDGLVYDVDANVVFRVVDVRRALIEIDDLDKGMHQMLGLSVQEILRVRERTTMYVSDDLDGALEENLSRRLEPWGVHVERAGFTSIRPSARTMRVTQLSANVGERERMLERIEGGGVPRLQALALLGATSLPVRRTHKLQRLARVRRRGRRIGKVLDDAFAAEALDASRLPLRWRGVYEERVYQGDQRDDPRVNLLFPKAGTREAENGKAPTAGRATSS